MLENWRECKLGDVAEIVGGGTPKTSVPEYWNGNIPWLSVADFNTGKKYVSKTEKTITEQGLKNSSTKLLEKNDIIISARGTVGALAILEKPMTFNQSCYGVRAKENKSTNDYIFYLLRNAINELLQISHGGVFDTITKTTFDKIDISLPPLQEQKAIAEILSSLDDKIDLLHRQNYTLESLANTLFRQWFIEEANPEWEEKPLGDLLTITSSKRIFYSEYTSNGIPFYRSKEIIQLCNKGLSKSELYITEKRFNEINQKFGVPKEGDILLTSVGTLGIPYRVNADDKFYFKDGNLTWLKNFITMPSIIIFYWIKSDIGREELNSIAIGSTQPALTISGLKEIKLPMPPLKIIEKLTIELNLLNNKIRKNQKQIQTLENLRDTLLPKLISGEVRVDPKTNIPNQDNL